MYRHVYYRQIETLCVKKCCGCRECLTTNCFETGTENRLKMRANSLHLEWVVFNN